MNHTATAPAGDLTSSASAYNSPAFWERLWRVSGINFVVFFVVTYFIYGYQPNVGTSGDALVAFFNGSSTRILLAASLFGLNILNLMWFAAALRTTLADRGRDGWGTAATASSTVIGALFLLLVTVSATLAYSIVGSGNTALASGLNDFTFVLVVLSSFPRAMLI